MTSSSYIWRGEYDTSAASPHDFPGEPSEKRKPSHANAAASLHTTAGDFALFVAEILSPQYVDRATIDAMLESQGVVGIVAEPMFRSYLVPFEITSLLLLVAIVGAIVLARRKAP